VAVTCLLSGCSSSNFQSQMAVNPTPTAGANTPFPDLLNDPAEPINRGIWTVNEGLLFGVIHPSAKVYRTVVPTRARESIQDFSRNISYPGRMVNHMLQGRWDGAGDETLRFVTNSTVGLAGFFDPATKWNIEKSDANFSQTFGKWGWQPKNYVMLPFFGPSDERNAVGLVADKFSEPMNYGDPYDIASPITTYNRLSDLTEEAKRLIQIDPDPYSTSKIVWTYSTKDGVPDLTMRGPIDLPTLQTFGAVKFGPKDPKFLTQSREISVKIPSTGRRMKCNYWVQTEPAPLVYISPGLISHRLSSMSIGLAEQLYQNGYSVVTTTSVFHPEFMSTASTAALPVYPPVDSLDLLVAITETDRALVKKYPDRFTKRAMMGLSMGGFETLQIAVREAQSNSDLMTFDRYIAVDMPVDITHGFKELDKFVNAPLKWPEDGRQERLNNAMHKVSYAIMSKNQSKQSVMFDGDESKYLVGLSFRFGLRDIIFESQSKNDLGVLQNPISNWNRGPVYDEILKYSLSDYFERFAVPYYKQKGISKDQLLKEVNLKTQGSKLRAQSKVRVIVNKNDFLLRPEDLSWLRSTFPKSRLTIFPEGGHLGNIGDPKVQQAIMNSLDGLK
jgi:ABC-type transporter lipoprotein component MlaA/pimeloyl-ACP methyl ester carboxylesterase